MFYLLKKICFKEKTLYYFHKKLKIKKTQKKQKNPIVGVFCFVFLGLFFIANPVSRRGRSACLTRTRTTDATSPSSALYSVTCSRSWRRSFRRDSIPAISLGSPRAMRQSFGRPALATERLCRGKCSGGALFESFFKYTAVPESTRTLLFLRMQQFDSGNGTQESRKKGS